MYRPPHLPYTVGYTDSYSQSVQERCRTGFPGRRYLRVPTSLGTFRTTVTTDTVWYSLVVTDRSGLWGPWYNRVLTYNNEYYRAVPPWTGLPAGLTCRNWWELLPVV